jgi:hypothetical protein
MHRKWIEGEVLTVITWSTSEKNILPLRGRMYLVD